MPPHISIGDDYEKNENEIWGAINLIQFTLSLQITLFFWLQEVNPIIKISFIFRIVFLFVLSLAVFPAV